MSAITSNLLTTMTDEERQVLSTCGLAIYDESLKPI